MIAVVILFVFILLALLIVIGKRCKCAQKVAVVIKKKLLYNTLLRYVLQSSLKMQISACTIIAYMKMTTKEVDKPPTEAEVINSVVILVFLNICPVIFYFVVSRNTDNLDR